MVAVPLGPWVEFRRKRPVMVAMDLSNWGLITCAAVAAGGVRPIQAAWCSCGRPNSLNRPGSRKVTIRAMPWMVSVGTVIACAW